MELFLAALAGTVASLLVTAWVLRDDSPARPADAELWGAVEVSDALTTAAQLDGLPNVLAVERDGEEDVIYQGDLFGAQRELARCPAGQARLPRIGHGGRRLWVDEQLRQDHRRTRSTLTQLGPDEHIDFLSADPRSPRVAYRVDRSGLVLHDLETGETQPIATPPGVGRIVDLDVSWSSELVLLAIQRPKLGHWPIELWHGPFAGPLRHVGVREQVTAVSLAPDGTQALVASDNDQHTRCFDLISGNQTRLST